MNTPLEEIYVPPIYITAWIENLRLDDALIDGGATVKIVSESVVKRLPGIKMHTDKAFNVILATDLEATLSKYVYLPVNVSGVCARVKAYVLSVAKGYDILLGLRWGWSVGIKVDFRTHQLTIQGVNDKVHPVATQMFPPEVQKNLPKPKLKAVSFATKMEVYEEDPTTDVDDVLQQIIDEKMSHADGNAMSQSLQRWMSEHGSSGRIVIFV